MTKLPENLLRPPFDSPMMPSTLRFGSDPNLSQNRWINTVKQSNWNWHILQRPGPAAGPPGRPPQDAGDAAGAGRPALPPHLQSVRDGRPNQRVGHPDHHYQGQGDSPAAQRWSEGKFYWDRFFPRITDFLLPIKPLHPCLCHIQICPRWRFAKVLNSAYWLWVQDWQCPLVVDLHTIRPCVLSTID